MISRTAAYALQSAVILARLEPGERARAADMADELQLPANYLSKILNTMARAGLLRSERGPTGGFRLARPASEVAINDVIGLFEETGSTRRCFLGRGDCSEEDSCPMHHQWKEVSAPLFDFFHNTTLAQIVEDEAGRKPRRGRRSTR